MTLVNCSNVETGNNGEFLITSVMESIIRHTQMLFERGKVFLLYPHS